MAKNKTYKLLIEGLQNNTKETVSLREALESLTKSIEITNEARTASAQKIKEETDAQKKLSEATDEQSEKNKKFTGSMKEIKGQIDSLTKQYTELNKSERESTKVGGALLGKIQELRGSYRELENTLNSMNSLDNLFDNLSKGIKSVSDNAAEVVNVFKTGTDLMSSFGIESKTANKIMEDFNKSLKIINSLQAAYNAILKVTTTTTNTSSVALKGFKAALTSTGIGAIAVLLGALVSNFDGIKEAVLEAIPPLKNVGQHFEKLQPIIKGIGNAVINYVLTPFKTVVAFIKGFMEDGISGAIKAGSEEFKNGMNVMKNYAEGYQKARVESEKKANDAIIEARKKANEEVLKTNEKALNNVIKHNEAKYGSDWKYTKEGQAMYNTHFNMRLALYAKDSEEYMKIMNEKLAFERSIQTHSINNSNKAAEEKKKITEKLEDQKLKLITDEQQKEIETLKLANKRKLAEIKGSSKEAIELRKLIENEGQKEIAAINKKYEEKKETDEKDKKEKLQEEIRSEIQKHAKITEESELKALKDTAEKRIEQIKGDTDEANALRVLIDLNYQKDKEALEEKYRKERQQKELDALKKQREEIDKIKNEDRDAKGNLDVEESKKNIEEKNKLLAEYLVSLGQHNEKEQTLYDHKLKKAEEQYGKDSEQYKKLQKEKEKALKAYSKQKESIENEIEKNEDEASALRLVKFKEQAEKLNKIAIQIAEGIAPAFTAISSIFKAEMEGIQEELTNVTKKHEETVKKREESDSRLNELEEKAKNAKGGRALILQEQISREMEANKQLAGQEAQLAKDKEKLEKDKAKKEKQQKALENVQKKVDLAKNITQGISNTALGVTKAWSLGPISGPILAAIVAAAGALQVGVMTKQLAKFEDGGLLKGKRHSQGGMRIDGSNIEVEGGEFVINRQSTQKNLGLINYINSQRKELSPDDIANNYYKMRQSPALPFKQTFRDGGQIPSINTPSGIDNELLIEAIQAIKIEPKVSVTDINDAQSELVKVDSWTGL